MPRSSRPARLLVLAALVSASPVLAEDPTPPAPPACPAAGEAPAAPTARPLERARADASLERARADASLERARALRATLAAPQAPWHFEGDLYGLGHRLGTVAWSAEPGTYQDKPCWVVSERTVREAGKARVVSELTAFLAPDLSLLRGEAYHKAPGGGSVTSFAWREGRLEVVEHGDGGDLRNTSLEVPASATLGSFSLLRVLGALPAEASGTYRIEGFDPRFAFGGDKGEPLPPDLADLTLTVLGPRTIHDGPALSLPRRTFAVGVKAGWGREIVVHLHPQTRALLGVDGVLPGLHVRPRGAWRDVAGPPAWFERVGQPPAGPFEAFVTFGRGYHLPRRELLEAAFHWPSMRAHETASGAYPADVPLEKVREDWVAEFERMSKHRTEGDCDDLIVQLLASAEIRVNDDGSLTVDTLPAFGDHAYTMAPIDGRWWIVKVD